MIFVLQLMVDGVVGITREVGKVVLHHVEHVARLLYHYKVGHSRDLVTIHHLAVEDVPVPVHLLQQPLVIAILHTAKVVII